MYPELLEHTLFLFCMVIFYSAPRTHCYSIPVKRNHNGTFYILQFPLITYFKICHIFRMLFYNLLTALSPGNCHQFFIIFLQKKYRDFLFFRPKRCMPFPCFRSETRHEAQ